MDIQPYVGIECNLHGACTMHACDCARSSAGSHARAAPCLIFLIVACAHEMKNIAMPTFSGSIPYYSCICVYAIRTASRAEPEQPTTTHASAKSLKLNSIITRTHAPHTVVSCRVSLCAVLEWSGRGSRNRRPTASTSVLNVVSSLLELRACRRPSVVALFFVCVFVRVFDVRRSAISLHPKVPPL